LEPFFPSSAPTMVPSTSPTGGAPVSQMAPEADLFSKPDGQPGRGGD
jgi:hypothetical protein